ncbi:MAG TPA: riboflavin synthase [Dehalococcoidia bacterium]|nr:riboflavin synthase [Dehalococcoidia bacterium]
MFTGIIEEIGKIRAAHRDRLVIGACRALEGTKIGDSISVNGVCLTVTDLSSDSFTIGVMPETLRRSNLGELRPGDEVNLERALGAGAPMGGHFVQGHVDGTGMIVAMTPEENAILVRISAPPEVTHYVVAKGFIAVDGVSLTVVDWEPGSFTVSLVPHTQANITLTRKRRGDTVNLEVDIIGKYVERFITARRGPITEAFLAEHGFIQ